MYVPTHQDDGILRRQRESGPDLELSDARLLPGVLIAFAGSDPQHRHSTGCFVGVPMTGRNNRKVACRQVPDGTIVLLEHCKFRLARQDEKKLVALAVVLPRWSTFEGGDATRASVERKVPDRTLRFSVQTGKVRLDHLGNGFVIKVVHRHHWLPLSLRLDLSGTIITSANESATVSSYARLGWHAAAYPRQGCRVNYVVRGYLRDESALATEAIRGTSHLATQSEPVGV